MRILAVAQETKKMLSLPPSPAPTFPRGVVLVKPLVHSPPKRVRGANDDKQTTCGVWVPFWVPPARETGQ
jgi:hypothetical protein